MSETTLQRIFGWTLLGALALGVLIYAAVCRAPVVQQVQQAPTPTIAVVVGASSPSPSPSVDPTLAALLSVSPTVFVPEPILTSRPSETPTPLPSATVTATPAPPTPTAAVQRG